MAIDQTIQSLGGVTLEEIYDMEPAIFQELLGSVMESVDDSAKPEKYKEIKNELADKGEIVNAQRYALRDLSEAARQNGDLNKAAQADALLASLDGISEFIDDFSSTWGNVDKAQSELNQVMTSTGYQINYSSLGAISASLITVDATGLAAAGGLFGVLAAARPYAILNLNPGEVISGEPVLDTFASPCTLSVQVTSVDGAVTRIIKIEAASADAMPAIKLNGSTGGLTEDEIKTWPSSVRELFYESVTAEHNFEYGITGSETGTTSGVTAAKNTASVATGAASSGTTKKTAVSRVKITDTLKAGSIAAGLSQRRDSDETS